MERTTTSPYFAQSNGMTERCNATIQGLLKPYVNQQATDWDELLPYVMAAYRASRQESTGLTPNYLMFGRELKNPLELLLGNAPGKEPCPHHYAIDLEEKFQKAYQYARIHLGQSAERQKKQYDITAKPFPWKENMWVWYGYYPLQTKKLRSPWLGPFKIIKIKDSVNVEIKKYKNSASHFVHVNKLKPYRGTEEPKWEDGTEGALCRGLIVENLINNERAVEQTIPSSSENIPRSLQSIPEDEESVFQTTPIEINGVMEIPINHEKCKLEDCKKPVGIVNWVQCDVCESWFHNVCIDMPDRAGYFDAIDYVCESCNSDVANNRILVSDENTSMNENDGINSIGQDDGNDQVRLETINEEESSSTGAITVNTSGNCESTVIRDEYSNSPDLEVNDVSLNLDAQNLQADEGSLNDSYVSVQEIENEESENECRPHTTNLQDIVDPGEIQCWRKNCTKPRKSNTSYKCIDCNKNFHKSCLDKSAQKELGLGKNFDHRDTAVIRCKDCNGNEDKVMFGFSADTLSRDRKTRGKLPERLNCSVRNMIDAGKKLKEGLRHAITS